MALDVDALLTDLPGDEPCGPYVEVTEKLSRGKAVIQGAQKWAEFKRFPGRFPDASMQPDEVSRQDVDGAIKGLLEFFNTSRDMRAIAFLAQGFALRGRLDDLADILTVANRLVGSHWEFVNPRIEDSAYDTAAERIDPLRPLNDGDRLWWLIRETKLTDHSRYGSFTLGDLAPRARPDEDKPPPPEGIDAALDEMGAESLEVILNQLASIDASLLELETGIAAALRATGGEAEEVPAPEFDEARKELKPIIAALQRRMGGDETEVEEDVGLASGGGGSGEGPKAAGVSAPGTISSRQDVLRAIQSIIEFYNKSEPASPVPLLLERASKLVGKDFLQILEDLAPDTVDEITKLAGRQKQASADDY